MAKVKIDLTEYLECLPSMPPTAMPQELDVAALHSILLEAGDCWARANETATKLEKLREPLLCSITLDYIQGSAEESDVELGSGKRIAVQAKRISRNEAELYSKTDQRYLDHIDAMATARKVSDAFRIRYDSCQKLIDMLRTKEASDRHFAGK